jgi:hypothetical protein
MFNLAYFFSPSLSFSPFFPVFQPNLPKFGTGQEKEEKEESEHKK